jgi:hypothetical protein
MARGNTLTAEWEEFGCEDDGDFGSTPPVVAQSPPPVVAQKTGRGRVDFKGSTEWGRLSKALISDVRISVPALVWLAIRATFADDRAGFGLSTRLVASLKIKGLKNPAIVKKTIADLKRLGILTRPVVPVGQFTEDWLLPQHGPTLTVLRCTFDGNFSANAIAALLFIQAGGVGKSSHVYRRELCARFGWSRPTAARVLGELQRQNLIEKTEVRNEAGQVKEWRYSAQLVDLSTFLSSASKTTLINSSASKTTHNVLSSLPSLSTDKKVAAFAKEGETRPQTESVSGWSLSDIQSAISAETHFDVESVSAERMAEINRAATEEQIILALSRMTRLRRDYHMPKFIAGVATVRWLAAVVRQCEADCGGEMGPEDALYYILASIGIWTRRQQASLPNLTLIAINIASKIMAGNGLPAMSLFG